MAMLTYPATKMPIASRSVSTGHYMYTGMLTDDMVTVRRNLVQMRYYRTTEEMLQDKTIDFKHN